MKPQHLVCFSHLRWNFVYQRPQHIMTRFSNSMKVTYIEEPIFENDIEPHYVQNKISDSLTVLTPYLSAGQSQSDEILQQQSLLKGLVGTVQNEQVAFWYYTPMALEFSRICKPGMIVYDCMDELAAFKFAPAKLKELEAELFAKADLVFTGGHSLYEAKKHKHSAIYPFPSSIDKEHFASARTTKVIPVDQETIEGVKLGFYGVIDERFDIELIRQMAELRPSWQIILLGPVVKIDPADLPRAANIHYLGQKTYNELPAYLSGWDIAMIPFMLNESTRFISPTKTPEYLAAGVPVVSTPIRDVVDPYGVEELVSICSDADEFVKAAEQELNKEDKAAWLHEVDTFLADMSWDKTTWYMLSLINKTAEKKFKTVTKSAYV